MATYIKQINMPNNINIYSHYRNRRLCRVPEALGKALKTLGKEGSAHSASVKPSLSSTFSWALDKEVCRVPGGHSAKKSSRYGAVLTETASLPSVPGDTRQRSYLCRVSAWQHSAKNLPEGVPISGTLPSA
jgi:hypothetical protein